MSDLDSILKELLKNNPTLAASIVKKLAPTQSSKAQRTPSVPVKRSYPPPRPDYRLIVYSGCETCHAIVETGFEMTWDAEHRLFKQRILNKKNPKAFVFTEKQYTTTSACSACTTELALLQTEDLIKLVLLNITDPIGFEARTVLLKKRLRALVTGSEAVSPAGELRNELRNESAQGELRNTNSAPREQLQTP